jgi:Fe-S-cluster formation regulator IscX/YfhJ
MGLRWTDVQDIAIELEDAHPEADVVNLRFTDLHRSNEKILEAIQMAWIAERS